MALSVSTIDALTHATNALLVMSDGRRAKFPKVKPASSTYANDAAWQTAAQAELVAAVNQSTGGPANATALLAHLA